jgi:hypothetical protein
MDALDEEAGARLSIRVLQAPARARAGTTFAVQVELGNGTRIRIGSFPPFPVRISYHWISQPSGKTAVFEGKRTPLRTPVDAGECRRYVAHVAAPSLPGSYLLRLTLVQEGHRWLDQQAAPVLSDVNLWVEECA